MEVLLGFPGFLFLDLEQWLEDPEPPCLCLGLVWGRSLQGGSCSLS